MDWQTQEPAIWLLNTCIWSSLKVCPEDNLNKSFLKVDKNSISLPCYKQKSHVMRESCSVEQSDRRRRYGGNVFLISRTKSIVMMRYRSWGRYFILDRFQLVVYKCDDKFWAQIWSKLVWNQLWRDQPKSKHMVLSLKNNGVFQSRVDLKHLSYKQQLTKRSQQKQLGG